MKKRSFKRFLAGLLSAVLAVTSVPVMEVQAVPSTDTIQEYDYAKMYSLEGGKSGDYIAGNYKDTGKELKREMNYGEMTYLEFALSYNTPAKIELFIKGEPEPVGYVYGISYRGHVNKRGTPPIYLAKAGMNQTKIRNEMTALSKTEQYGAVTEHEGISLTGRVLPYGTLAEYYDYYGMEPPSVMNAEAQEEETETEEIKETEEIEEVVESALE